MLAIISNNKEEVGYLLNKATIINDFTFCNFNILEAKIKNIKVIFIITGYSALNIGLALGYTLSHFKISEIINLGNTASINEDFKIGDIAISSQTINYHLNYSIIDFPLTTTPDNNISIIPANNNLIKKTINYSEKLFFNYKIGRFGANDNFISNKKEKNLIKTTFNIDFLDLSSSFIGTIAYKLEIPFIIIKGISNYADEFSGEDYKNYHKIANENACTLAYNIILKQ